MYSWKLHPPLLSPGTNKNNLKPPSPCLRLLNNAGAWGGPTPSPTPSRWSPLSPGPRERLWPLRQAQRKAAPSTAAPWRTLPVLQDPHQPLPPSSLWAHPAPWPLHTSPILGHHRNSGGTVPCQGLGTGQLCVPMALASALPQRPHSEMGPGSHRLCSTMWSASGKEESSGLQASAGTWGRA